MTSIVWVEAALRGWEPAGFMSVCSVPGILIETRGNRGKIMTMETHAKAADLHGAAAKSHAAAAALHKKGDHDGAKAESTKAHASSGAAHNSSTDAHIQSCCCGPSKK